MPLGKMGKGMSKESERVAAMRWEEPEINSRNDVLAEKVADILKGGTKKKKK
jgi:hypothetical protein